MQVKLKSFKKLIASNATPERIANLQIITNSCKIKALSANTGSIFIGDELGQEFELKAKEEISLTELFEKSGGSADFDLQDLFCKVAVNGEGLCVIYADRGSRTF